MTGQAFLTALDERIARYDRRQYASRLLPSCGGFPAYLSALHTRLEDGELRRSVLRNLLKRKLPGVRTARCGWTLPKVWEPTATPYGTTRRWRKFAG